MNFLFKVIRIFFRNKYYEIIKLFRKWRSPQWRQVLKTTRRFIISILLVGTFIGILFGITSGLGYIMVDVLGMPENGEPYCIIGSAGIVMIVLLGFFGYVSVKIIRIIAEFITWIWKNIELAIAEAKEE